MLLKRILKDRLICLPVEHKWRELTLAGANRPAPPDSSLRAPAPSTLPDLHRSRRKEGEGAFSLAEKNEPLIPL